MYVCMYVYPQTVQCNSMLVYVYPERLQNTILCLRMYVRHACATIVQFSGQTVPRGQLQPQTTVWPVWPISYARTQLQAFQVLAPLTAHHVQFQ